MTSALVTVQLPFHLQRLAGTSELVNLEVAAPQTQQSLLMALELRYPTLRGAVVDLHTGKRRPMIRFFACKQDLSFAAPEAPLPDAVIKGQEPFMIVGAISGG